MKFIMLTALFSVALAAQAAHATPYYFGAEYQWSKIMLPSDLKDAADPANGFGLLGGYKLDNHWAIELGYDHFKFGKVDMTHSLLGVSSVYRYRTGFITPYARVGLGYAENSYPGGDALKSVGAHLGGGAEFNFKPITVYAGARWDYLGDTHGSGMNLSRDGHSLGIVVGVIFPAFDSGEAEASQPVAEATPAKKVVDSDGDGVPDDMDKCPNTAPGAKVNAYGCSADQVAIIKINVEFAAGKSDIPPQYDSEIESLATFMKANPEIKVEIAGHTDNSGAAKTNTALSKKRAEAVAHALVHKFGIDQKRVTAKGYGPSKPIADNKTADGRKANRRVEAEILK